MVALQKPSCEQLLLSAAQTSNAIITLSPPPKKTRNDFSWKLSLAHVLFLCIVCFAAYMYILGPMLWFLKYFRRKILRKNWRFWLKAKQNFDHNIDFWEKRQFFRRKLSKIAENCDHNIDPWFCTTFVQYNFTIDKQRSIAQQMAALVFNLVRLW
jgi:hypothetical protein